MTTMRRIVLVGVAVLGLSTGAAEAGLLKIVGGNAYSTPGVNNFSVGWAGRVNGDVVVPGRPPITLPPAALSVLTTATNVELTFAFLYRESGFTKNRFVVAGGNGGQTDFISTDRTNLATSGPFPAFSITQAGAGLIDFKFITEVNPNNPNNNGEAADPGGTRIEGPKTIRWFDYGFFATTNAPTGAGKAAPVPSGAEGDVVWLAFDDGGALDDNHDDMIIRISAVRLAVPEPGTLALLGAGMLGLGLIRRTRRRD